MRSRVRSIELRERSSPCPGDGRISDKCPDFGRNPDSCAGEIGRLRVPSLLLWSSTGRHTYHLEMIMETSDLTSTILRGIRDDIANLGNRLDAKIDKLGTRLDDQSGKLDELALRLDKHDRRFDRLDNRMDKLDSCERDIVELRRAPATRRAPAWLGPRRRARLSR
jgi:hypothetical protein